MHQIIYNLSVSYHILTNKLTLEVKNKLELNKKNENSI